MAVMAPSIGSPDAVIQVDGLGKHFGDVKAVDGVDLQVPAGTILGLLGPNGAGKTTIIRMLTTILRPDTGTASVLGIDVAQDPQGVRERIGLAGQYAAVDENLTGRENLRMVCSLTHLPKSIIKGRSDELLERFNLMHAADRPVRTYSGGMRRRLDLGAALVHKPPVLFLDEPTTGLDPQSRNDLWQVIQELVDDGTTVLLTTQYLEEADRLADNISVIDGGKKIAEGTAAELKATLGATVIEVVFSDPHLAQQAKALSEKVGSTDVDHDGRTLRVNVADSGKSVLQLVRILDAANAAPDALTVREPTLDDVFLALTGHVAEADKDAVDAKAENDPTGRGNRRKKGPA
jgi:ABC-2 type transport system ATP-binding protein